MSTYTDKYNGGKINYIYGTNPSGDVFNLGNGQDYCYGDRHDQYNLMYNSNMYLSPYGNIFDSAGTQGNSINLIGKYVDLFLAEFSPGDSIQNHYCPVR